MANTAVLANTVLVGGTINTDLVARLVVAPAAGETVTGTAFSIFGGGKSANQATAAARAGAPTVILGAVGQDDFGRQRLADLTTEGIDITDVAVTDQAASGVALITVEESTGQNRIAYVPGATLTVTPEQALAALARSRPGFVLATLELPLPALDALFSAARDMGAQVILNATPEPETGRFLLDRTDVLIVNETEASDLLGYNVSAAEGARAAEALRGLGPATVVVTLGAAGAVLATADQTTPIPAPEVTVVDTTAAGDAFCGAMAASLASGESMLDAARLGVITGSLATTRQGAQPSIPTRDEIDAFLAASS